MTLRRNSVFVFFVMLVVLVLSSPALSAAPGDMKPPRWELGIGFGFCIPLTNNNTYNNTFTPAFQYSEPDDYVATSSQVLNLMQKKSIGQMVIVNRLIAKKTYLQLLAVYQKRNIYGNNQSYHTFLEYTAYPYPNFVPTLVTREEDFPWSDSEGTLSQYAIGINIMKRVSLGYGVTVDFSGGPGLFHYKGEVSKLGYNFYTFSHYILVSFPAGFQFTFKSPLKVGLNFGCELNVPVLHRLKFFVGGRCFYCPRSGVDIHLVDSDDYYFPAAVEEVEAIMNLQPLKINTSYFSLGGGFRWEF